MALTRRTLHQTRQCIAPIADALPDPGSYVVFKLPSRLAAALMHRLLLSMHACSKSGCAHVDILAFGNIVDAGEYAATCHHQQVIKKQQ